MRIRESFKISYLKKYDWNLQRMNSEKKRQSQEANDNSNQQRLLDDAGENSTNQQKSANNSKAVLICREILMVITCCYCCFCFGGKVLIFLPFLVYLVCVCVCVFRARVWIGVCLSGFLFIYELNLWGWFSESLHCFCAIRWNLSLRIWVFLWYTPCDIESDGMNKYTTWRCRVTCWVLGVELVCLDLMLDSWMIV